MNIYLLEDDTQQLAQLTATIQQIANETNTNSLAVNTFQSTDQLSLILPPPSQENVFILDLEINGVKQAGLKLSELIRQHDELASIIYITVHDQFLYNTYKARTRAVDFIAKDRGHIYEELKKDLTYIQTKLMVANTHELFTYRAYNQIRQIPLQQICFFESNHHNTHSSLMYTTDNQQIQLNYNMHELEAMDNHFYRAHRSYLVNPLNIRRIDKFNRVVFFNNNLSCPISRRHLKGLLTLTHQN